MMDILLEKWEVKGFYPHVPLLNNSVETGVEYQSITDWIPAKVPGCVQYDLWMAGRIKDPYYALNSPECEWVENRWWMYRSIFDFEYDENTRVYLHFKGLDYKCYIYFNRCFLGIHEGMFIPASFDISHLIINKDNELRLLFEHIPDEMGQIGYTSKTKTQKSRFTYKWDFSAHLVPIGIWDNVILKVTGNYKFDNVWLKPHLINGKGELEINCEVGKPAVADIDKKFDLTARIYYNEQLETTCNQEIHNTGDKNISADVKLCITNPKLWNVNGSGEQYLYRVQIELRDSGGISDRWEGNIGFRELLWQKNEDAPQDALPYTPVVNGRKVYIKGVNMVPLDVMYGTVTHDKYDEIVMLMREANINLVRVWGGGIIEKEYFYDLCDRNGILIWQEFIQSSSGIDNLPSKEPHFLELLEDSAVSSIKSRRNHVSLACWCGGNELTYKGDIPITFDDENVAMLKGLVNAYDPGRYFLPSSPSGPNNVLLEDKYGINHDVHGPWMYGGIEKHYKLYNLSDSMLHSEFGIQGYTSISSLKKFLPEELLKPIPFNQNETLRHHGEIWDCIGRDLEIFGPLSDLSDEVKVSQWVQAEGLRYALEANRRRKFKNSGSIIWQLNEPWPNVACTSLVDYYNCPKMAYYWMKNAYAPIHASLKYNKLSYRLGENFEAEMYIHNSMEGINANWMAECIDMAGNILWVKSGQVQLHANNPLFIERFIMEIGPNTPELFGIRIQLETLCESPVSFTCKNNSNFYIFSTAEQPVFKALLSVEKPRLIWTQMSNIHSDDVKQQSVYQVSNDGDTLALYIKAMKPDSGEVMYSPQNYSVLLPGESMDFQVLMNDTREIKFSVW